MGGVSSGSSVKSIAAIAVAALAGVSLLVGIIYVRIYRKKGQKVAAKIPASSGQSHPPGPGKCKSHFCFLILLLLPKFQV